MFNWLKPVDLFHFQIELKFGKVGFWREGKTRVPKKTSRSKLEIQQQTQATYDFDAGFEPRPHWWARVLSLRHSCSPREIAKADWTYLIFLSFVNATTVTVSLTYPLRVQNLASFTEATFLALTGARSWRVVTCLFTAAWIIFFSFSPTVFL